MALRTTLGEVVDMARDEARLSSNSSRGTDQRASIVRMIKRHYILLADNYDWQHLLLREGDAQKQMAAGQRYYDYPSKLNTNKIDRVYAKFNTATWLPMDYGITPELYNVFSSMDDSRRDPPLAWQKVDDRQFEVWPIPQSDGPLVEFRGYRNPETLVDDNSRLDIDDMLVSLYVAGELLAANKQDDAKIKLQAAGERLQQLKAGSPGRVRVRVGMSQGVGDRRNQAFRSTIYVRS